MVNEINEVCVYFQAVAFRSWLMGPVHQSENQRNRHITENGTVHISGSHIGNVKL